jgi:cytochrome c2
MSWFFASWKLSEGDVQALSMLGKSASRNEAALAGEGDSVHGKAVFEKRCTGCSAMEADREGPHLAGVFGRKAGSVAGFAPHLRRVAHERHRMAAMDGGQCR